MGVASQTLDNGHSYVGDRWTVFWRVGLFSGDIFHLALVVARVITYNL